MSRITEDQVKEALDLINAYRIQVNEELDYSIYYKIDITQHLSIRAINAIDAYFTWNGIEYDKYKFGIDDISNMKFNGFKGIRRVRGCGKKTIQEISEFIYNKEKYFTVRSK